MQRFARRGWAARLALGLRVAAALGAVLPAHAAGIPVIDGANLSQNVLTAIESVAQTLKQIEQYRLQLQQYENMLTNTAAPAAYVWDQASRTVNQIVGLIDTVNYYKTQAGSIDAYLARYQNASHYRGSPCFGARGCTAAELQAVRDAYAAASDAQKRANDAYWRGLDAQQARMQHDAEQLVTLQSGAQSSQGQMAALQAANQLASHQANQLLQIRALLIAQQGAEVTRAQAIADREAQHAAASEQLRSGTFRQSSGRTW